MPAWALRASAIVVAMPWVAALFADYQSTSHGSFYGDRTSSDTGWALAAYGWAGPLMLTFAWYANPLLLWMLIRLARGRAPGTILSIVAFALALTCLLPSWVWDFSSDGRVHRETLSGLAVWLWLLSFASCVVLAQLAKPPSVRS